jgi:hypothetical protein
VALINDADIAVNRHDIEHFIEQEFAVALSSLDLQHRQVDQETTLGRFAGSPAGMGVNVRNPGGPAASTRERWQQAHPTASVALTEHPVEASLHPGIQPPRSKKWLFRSG